MSMVSEKVEKQLARRWIVCSPEYEWVDVIVDGQGPIEIVRDCVEVEADTARDARVLGVRLMRQQFRRGYHNRYSDDNPFSGLLVERALFTT